MEQGRTWRKVAGGLLAMGWLALLLATLLAGCAGRANAGNEADAPAAAVQQADAEEDAQQAGGTTGENGMYAANTQDTNATREGGVVFNGDMVTLTLDAETLETLGGGPGDFTGAGFTSVEATPGGGVALTMTAAHYAEMLDEMRAGIEDAMASIVADGTEYPSVEGVQADGDFLHFTLTVQRDAYEEGMESLVEMLLGIYSVSWQVYGGGPVQMPAFTLVDAATGEVYDSFSLAE